MRHEAIETTKLRSLAVDATNGGQHRLHYGGNSDINATTSFWQFNVSSTSTFNLNRVNAAGTVLNAINVVEDGTTRFTGANGFVEILHGVGGGIGIDIVNSGSVSSYLDFRMAGGDSDYDFRFIQGSTNLFNFTGKIGRSYEFNLPVTAKTNLTVEGNLTSTAGVGWISNPATGAGIQQYNLNGSARYQIGRNNAPETGGASGRGGSDFQIASYDNSGANPLVDVFISRAESRTTFLASGYRSGSFQSSHNQTTLTANRTVTWPDLGGQVVVRSDSTAPANGEILIGNGTQFVRAPLTAGSGISITPGAGSITIAASGGSSIGDLTLEAAVNPFDDFFSFRDTSAAADRRFAFLNHPLMRPDRYLVVTTNWFAPIVLSSSSINQNWGVSTASSGALSTAGTNNPAGWIRFYTGVNSSSRTAIHSVTTTDNHRIKFASGKRWYFAATVYLTNLSDATNGFVVKVGFDSQVTASTIANAALGFRYTHSESNGNWAFVARSNSVSTSIDTGIVPATTEGTAQLLEFLYTPGTGVQAWIDGVSVTAPTTNLPTGDTQPVAYQMGLYRTAGTADRSMFNRFATIVGEL